jgi:hypothetical protein
MDRKKCRGISKKVSRLLLVRIAEVLKEEIAREKARVSCDCERNDGVQVE